MTLLMEDTSRSNEADEVLDDVDDSDNDFGLVNHNAIPNGSHDDTLQQDNMLAQYKSVDPHYDFLTDKTESATDTMCSSHL